MVDKLFTVYTNINIEMKSAVRAKDVVLIVFKWTTNLFKGLSTKNFSPGKGGLGPSKYESSKKNPIKIKQGAQN